MTRYASSCNYGNFMSTYGEDDNKKEIWVATLIATSRHMSRWLWLLPSGPDQVHQLSLREDQKGRH